MGKNLNKILARPIYPYLYLVCFLLFKSSAYFKSFEVATAVLFLLGFSVCCFLLIQFFKIFTNPVYAAIPVLILCSALFHVVGVAKLLHFQYAYIPHYFYYSFYAFTILLIILSLTLLKNIPDKYAISFNQILNVFLVCATTVFCFTGLVSTLRDLKQEITLTLDGTKNKSENKSSLDIVWILMDEYGSSASLEKQMDFQNSLDTNLEKRGFQILKNTRSRFNKTLYSINCIFNVDDSITPSSYYQGFDLLTKSALVPILEKRGYRFVNMGFFNFNHHPMLADRSGYLHTYLQQISSGTLFGIVYAAQKYSLEKCDAYNQAVFEKLDDSLAVHSGKPRFIWAHVTIPHEPFCRDAKGNLQKEIFYTGTDSNIIKTNYLNYLQYGNSRLLQLIDKHPDLKEKIVIISGDHGPRYPYLKDKSLQYAPFVAVHFPNKLDTATINKIQFISQIPLLFACE